MAAAQSFKPLAMAELLLPYAGSASRTLASPSKPSLVLSPSSMRLLRLSCFFSPPYFPCFNKKKQQHLVPLVAQTSGLASQEDELDLPAEEGTETGDESGLLEWEGDEEQEEGGGEEEGQFPPQTIAGSSVMVEKEGGDLDENVEETYPEAPEEAKVFVGNIPYDMDSEKLAQLFDKAGLVEIAEVIYNRETDQSRGFGFVTMSTVEEAEKAVEMFNRYEVDGRLLTVNKAAPRGTRVERTFEPSFRLYVGNLPWNVDKARLEQVFSEYGKVLDAMVVCERDTGRSRGFGFVKLASQSEMDDAITALDGQDLDGRAWRVNVAAGRPRRASF